MVGKKGRSGRRSKVMSFDTPAIRLGTEVFPKPMITVRISAAVARHFPKIRGKSRSWLVCRLEDVGGWYEAGVLNTSKVGRGRPTKIEVQIFLADCRDGIFIVTRNLPKIWQRPIDDETGSPESRVISLARDSALAYGKPLPLNLKRQIKNARRIHFP